MDKIRKYQKAVRLLMEDYSKHLTNENNDNVRVQIIADEKNNHYQLLSIGWNGYEYWFVVHFHLDILDEKIWIQRNDTEWMIADKLVSNGVEKSDIVLGFILPSKRQYTGFATA